MDDLRHLIGAYFYELWDQHEYGSWQEAVDDYIRRSPERAARTPMEIETLLASSVTDEVLSASLADMELNHRPPEGDRAWLEAVRERIRSQL